MIMRWISFNNGKMIRVGGLPATVTINDYADYASPPTEVTEAVDTLKATKGVTTVNLGA